MRNASRTDPSRASRPVGDWWTAGALSGMLTALAVIAVAQLADPDNEGGGYMRVTFLVSLMLVTMSASRYVKGRWGLRRSSHDEFERHIMARAAARTHLVMLGLLAAVFAWLASTGLTGWVPPQSPSGWITLGVSIVGIGVGLPVLLAERMAPTSSADAVEEAAS